MVVIYIQKSWLGTIGEVADLLLTQEHPNDYISVLAGPTVVSFPFVDAELARKVATEKGEYFVPARIPATLISGIFDLTQGETKKFGFHPPERT
ncbi:MAG: hypothetical protein WB780_15410 [Candidatus Acidiferrales bacterium]